MGALSCGAAKSAAPILVLSVALATTPAFAATSDISAADTAWMIVATALVLMMTIPGLALFYSGLVRKKNVLATMAQSLAAVALISILWVAFGYSLVFVGDGARHQRDGDDGKRHLVKHEQALWNRLRRGVDAVHCHACEEPAIQGAEPRTVADEHQ